MGIAKTDRRRLLVIDDDAAIGRFVADVAEGLDYMVECFTEARGFLAALERGDPNVIILDLTMPGTDGFELLGTLAERGTRARIFVISGFDEAHQRMAKTLGEAKGLTMSGLIAKPVRAAELRKLLA